MELTPLSMPKHIANLVGTMKQYITIFLLLISISSFAQNQLHAVVLDAETLEPLPYVNVGIVGRALGTVTDGSGNVKLTIPDKYDNDSLRVSMIGYEAVTWLVADIKNRKQPLEIRLPPAGYEIKAVEVNSTKLKRKVLGSTSTSLTMAVGFGTSALGNEVCVKINVKKKPVLLSKFNFHIASSTCDTIIFRINIYDLKDGLPNQNLLHENVIVNTTQTSGPLSVDISPYRLWLEEDFAIGVEYIVPCKDKAVFFSGAFLGSIYSRTTSQANWETIKGFDLGFNVEVLR